MADSGINDQLINITALTHGLDVSFFVVCYLQCEIFNTIKLLNQMAPNVELIMKS